METPDYSKETFTRIDPPDPRKPLTFKDIRILNERPEGMAFDEYKLIQKLQREMIKYYKKYGDRG